MKKTILFAVSAMFLMFSCQKDNSQEESGVVSAAQKENWLSANLDSKFANSQKQVTAYLFANEEMSKLVKTPNITEVRFVLGYESNTIQVSIVGVDKSGKELGKINSTILKESNYEAKLSKLNELSVSKTNKRTPLVSEHLLLPKDAYAGILGWKEKLNSVKDLDEVTSYDGLRFRHFSLESSIVETMVNKANTANIGVFFGLNPKGKVTTILISLDKNNAVKKTSITSKGETGDVLDDVLDGVRPSPPY
ncbi:hypothetical protein [Flavobacterium sp. HTF]|uniref:hypothetical protein n=1 Tax=Flavobacterium sp. HTF TaxID=2170732 RepID=UPI000D5F60A7|nr:hypothetical protein [Flavobacterium sp. HTF]PWB19038.1 hypothetical protein DCO46_21975 [Flavobacterium sp. HTF]